MKTNKEGLAVFTPAKDEQCWTKEFLEEIKKKHNIIYSGRGCHAIRVVRRFDNNPLFIVMVEDDGALYDTDLSFDAAWTNSLVKVLKEAKEYVDEKGWIKWR